jgi:hypothetical protein
VKAPRFPTLADFLAAHARGEVSREASVVCSTMSGAVEIVAPTTDGDGLRLAELLFRAPTAETFVVDFATALGMKGRIA